MSSLDPVNEPNNSNSAEQIKVWDIAVRCFHWSLVLAFALAWVTAEEWDRVHELLGYVIGGLVSFRVFWGLVGGKYARFTNFVYAPSRILVYLKESLKFKSKRYLGHNPAGGAMIVLLILSLFLTVGSGFMMTTPTFWGVGWLEDIHEITANLTVLCVGFHIAGVVFSSLSHGENLVKSMITGYKRR